MYSKCMCLPVVHVNKIQLKMIYCFDSKPVNKTQTDLQKTHNCCRQTLQNANQQLYVLSTVR